MFKQNSNNVGNYRWTICALLFFGTTINYLDRQVLSLLHPILEKEFNWTNSDYGTITAVFQLAYALFMLLAGRAIDKLGTKKGYSIALIIWSVGAMIHAYAVEIGKATGAVLSILGITGISVSVLGFLVAVLYWVWAKQQISLPLLRQLPNISLKKNAPWLPGYLIRVQILGLFWLH